MFEHACASDVGGLRHWRISRKMAVHGIQREVFLVRLYYNELFINDLCAQLLYTTNILYSCQ